MKKISVVIPCYRSEQTIRGVVDEILLMFSKHQTYEYEIVLVNDCSPDGVWNVIKELVAHNPSIKGINFTKNFGQHAAILAGYGIVTGDYVFSMDDDGQAPVDEMFLLIEELEKGYDVVYGSYPEIKQSLFRRFGSWVNMKMMEHLLEWPKNSMGSSFFVCRRVIVDEMRKYQNAFPYLGGLIIRTTRNIGFVEVHQRQRVQGTSGYSFGKLLGLWVNGFTAFSAKPLRMATFIGIASAMLGFLYGIYVIIHKIVQPQVMIGYSSLAAIMLFIGGIIMLLLGIIGEYVGRIYISINNAPQYVIKEIAESEETVAESE